jgi:glycosyltransferase involved in cell wall biosynthesis
MAKKANSAFMKPMKISDELAEVVGKGPMPRSEVVKQLWAYIKKNKLQDTKNRRNIKTYFAPISDRQKELYPNLNYTRTVYNGIDQKAFAFSNNPGSYLLFVGRIRDFFINEKGEKIDPKGVTDAIRVAQKTGERLKILGNVESYQFFSREIQPHLSDKIEFVGDPHSAEGNLSLEERVVLYQGAKALLLPVHWEEPFGIVMIEAMACGTPVIAYNKGAIPEVIIQGKNGFVVENEDQMVKAVSDISKIDRSFCRKVVEERFTIRAMVSGYEAVYKDVIALWKNKQ